MSDEEAPLLFSDGLLVRILKYAIPELWTITDNPEFGPRKAIKALHIETAKHGNPMATSKTPLLL
jgi:hypothetical protein